MKLLGAVLVLGFVVYMSFFHWYLVPDGVEDRLGSCPVCECACSERGEPLNIALTELLQAMLPDCEQLAGSPYMRDGEKLLNYQLLRDTLNLHIAKSQQAAEQSERALMVAREEAEQYRQDVGRCIRAMWTAENVKKDVKAILEGGEGDPHIGGD